MKKTSSQIIIIHNISTCTKVAIGYPSVCLPLQYIYTNGTGILLIATAFIPSF